MWNGKSTVMLKQPKKSFKRWLLSQHKVSGPVGHLAGDFRYDFKDKDRAPDEEPLPARFTYRTALAYLKARNACAGALQALNTAHREWRFLL